ncbi:Gfo/Idh/MocA family protein [Nesterenkonia sp. K-15-9-6]|uniref:Gfo/Idh/MocA family protein n=1 Tax=Nesterenkonia sp. K-15-9-6 TaxID=3093918 RepID=UPI0040442441
MSEQGGQVRPGAERVRLGMVGAGNISGQYLETISRLEALELVAVADLDLDRARAVAEPHGAAAEDLDGLLGRDDVDLVLNLTVPQAHADVSSAAIRAGKGVYVEKPFTADVASGREVLRQAREAGVVIGSAPDTVLGTGVQTARAALDAGQIGTPMSATATMVIPGHEAWHPNPDFYYQPGGGPLLDMGPYYLTTLVTLLGPVRQVIGAAGALRDERVIGSGPRAGERITVTTPSHVTGALVHTSGAISTVVMSFDGAATHAAPLEIQGTEGALAVPDPNRFDGSVSLFRGGAGWEELPVAAGYREAARGYGIADLLWSGAFDGDPLRGRAQGELGLHVLEVMDGLLSSAESGRAVDMTTTAERPDPVSLSSAAHPAAAQRAR